MFLTCKIKNTFELFNNMTIVDTFNCFVLFVCLMVFNATFNNISVISWRSVL